MKKNIYGILCALILSATVCWVGCTRSVGPAAEDLPAADSLRIARGEERADDLPILNEEWALLSSQQRNEELIERARPVYLRARARGDRKMMTYAGAYIGQAFGMLFEPDSMYRYFDEILEPAREGDYAFPLMVLNNTIGVHNLMYAMNYDEALRYFYEALDHCREVDRHCSYQILYNIVNAYYLRNDPEGLDAALEIYAYGVEEHNDGIRYLGALMTAYMYYVAKDYPHALEYVELASRLDAFRGGINNSDALHANILARMGRDAEAEKFYELSLQRSLPDYATLIESYSSYGDYLSGKGRYEEAIRHYLAGLEYVKRYEINFYGYKLYVALADAYAATGRNDKAIRYMKTYQGIADSVFNVERERAFNSLRLRYENQKQRNDLQERDIRILRSQRRNYFLLSIAVLLLVCACTILVLYRRKTIMYRRLVEHYELHLKRERLLAERMRVQESVSDADPERSDAKLRELYEELNRLMTDEELYRCKDISIEAAARRLNTNRSYLSRAVNRFSGTSFAGYVNTFRITKAVEMLSDPENPTPIKALADELGYNNLASFYTNFRNETGVPPSRYRQEAQRIRMAN